MNIYTFPYGWQRTINIFGYASIIYFLFFFIALYGTFLMNTGAIILHEMYNITTYVDNVQTEMIITSTVYKYIKKHKPYLLKLSYEL